MQTYRVAILGCRGRGTAAARAYHQHPRTQVVGLCDLLSERLATLGNELGVAARYTDLDEMIRQLSPDLVAIPTGTEFHYPLAMRVIEHGCHIDVEKPLCTRLDEADRLLAAAAAKGVKVAVHHQGRVGAPMRAVKAALEEGRIGRPRFVQGSGKGYYAGYGLMNIGTHSLNNMLGLVGPCRSVTAQILVAGRRPRAEDVLEAAGGMGLVVGEHMTAALEFDAGVTGVLLQHRFPKVDSTAYALEVCGEEGRLLWRGSEAWWLPVPHSVPGGEARWEALPLVPLEGFDADGLASEADYAFADAYVRALDAGGEHPCNGEEGRHVMEIMLGLMESGVRGRRVDLPQTDRDHPLAAWRAEAGMAAPEAGPRPYGEWLAAEDQRLGRPQG